MHLRPGAVWQILLQEGKQGARRAHRQARHRWVSSSWSDRGPMPACRLPGVEALHSPQATREEEGAQTGGLYLGVGAPRRRPLPGQKTPGRSTRTRGATGPLLAALAAAVPLGILAPCLLTPPCGSRMHSQAAQCLSYGAMTTCSSSGGLSYGTCITSPPQHATI